MKFKVLVFANDASVLGKRKNIRTFEVKYVNLNVREAGEEKSSYSVRLFKEQLALFEVKQNSTVDL